MSNGNLKAMIARAKPGVKEYEIKAAAARLGGNLGGSSEVLLSRSEDVQLFEGQKQGTIRVDLSL